MTAAPRVPIGPPGTSAAAAYEPMSMWIVYDHPLDDREAFVARRWEITAGKAEPTIAVMRDHDLDRLRGVLRARGLFCLKRTAGDDPVIVEVWL